MRILILGGDGYLGWPTAMRFSEPRPRGPRRRQLPAAPRPPGGRAPTPSRRSPRACPSAWRAWKDVTGIDDRRHRGRPLRLGVDEKLFRDFRPEAIIHYGEMPCAPYSMKDRDHAVFTQTNNVVNTLNVLFAMRDVRARRATW